MSGSIFEDVKIKIRLLDYVSKFVNLKFVGHRYLGICPFHFEKTPSFYVDDERNLFYCFGCNKGGDIISFYCFLNNCEKKDAIKELAKVAGIKFKEHIISNDLDILLKFFVSFNQHVEFLFNRGLTEESISKFKLGWAPDYFSIINFIKKNNLALDELGMKDSFLKAFQNRIVFPIFNEIGKLVSFSGRNLENGPYKYLNGAESDIFHKNEVLYGLNFIKNREEIFLVEGYLDVIMMIQNGYSAVASMGTAVSSEQIKMIWKYSNKIVIGMDGDIAGQKAAKKIAILALSLIKSGKEMSFIIFNESDDPASYLKSGFKIEDLKRYSLYEYLVYINGRVPDNPDKRVKFFSQFNDYVELIKDSIIKGEYRRYWNSLRYSRKDFTRQERLTKFSGDYLILLLFKYVVCYNEILDHVAEDFLKLNMGEIYMRSLINMLNGEEVNSEFLNKVNQVNIDNLNLDIKQIVDEWYCIYYYIQEILNEQRKQVLLEDFSEESWEKFKKLIEEKDQN